MTEKERLFSQLKQKINSERKRGDIKVACLYCGLGRLIYYSAMNRKKEDDLTFNERKMLEAIIGQIRSHKERKELSL